jgi:hypothetical protein
MAARGIPSYFAVAGSWTITVPPWALTARAPMTPSLPVPDRITPIARSPWAAASDFRKKSTGSRCPGSSERGDSRRRPPASSIQTSGGMT